MLFLAWPCKVFAFPVWFGALEHVATSPVAGFIYLVPMLSISFGLWVLGEPIRIGLLLGTAVLTVGV